MLAIGNKTSDKGNGNQQLWPLFHWYTESSVWTAATCMLRQGYILSPMRSVPAVLMSSHARCDVFRTSFTLASRRK
eukprot:4758765-Amphidinium_carterae.1